MLMWGVGLGCGGESQPTTPIETLIAAARDDNPSALSAICAPGGAADGDARRVCAVRREDVGTWAMVREWFGAAKIVGLSEIRGEEVVIEVEMGPDRRVIPMTVVSRGGRWYLLRF